MRMGDASGYENAVANSRALISAAARAGVQRIVQFSVIKPSLDSPYPYFQAKARVEEIVRVVRCPGRDRPAGGDLRRR